MNQRRQLQFHITNFAHCLEDVMQPSCGIALFPNITALSYALGLQLLNHASDDQNLDLTQKKRGGVETLQRTLDNSFSVLDCPI